MVKDELSYAFSRVPNLAHFVIILTLSGFEHL